MYQTVPVEKKVKNSADNVWLKVIGLLFFLGFAVLVSRYKPEWVNFIWLSIATVAAAGIAGWIIGFLLDKLFEEADWLS